MATFDVAHVNVQGEELIIVCVAPSVGSMSNSGQANLLTALQFAARSAGLRGNAVLAWQQGSGLGTYGPRSYGPFLRSISPNFVAANINRTLTCG